MALPERVRYILPIELYSYRQVQLQERFGRERSYRSFSCVKDVPFQLRFYVTHSRKKVQKKGDREEKKEIAKICKKRERERIRCPPSCCTEEKKKKYARSSECVHIFIFQFYSAVHAIRSQLGTSIGTVYGLLGYSSVSSLLLGYLLFFCCMVWGGKNRKERLQLQVKLYRSCLLYTSPSPRDS